MNKNNPKQASSRKTDAKVSIGSRVSIVDLSTGELLEYKVVTAAQPGMQHDEVSSWSPLGMALSGRRIGETVYVQAPKLTRCYKIVKITEAS